MPESNNVTLGILPLTDSAVIAVAKERGFFDRHGVNVDIQREHDWAAIRDKVAAGAYDGAHMLAPMVVSSTLEPADPSASAFTTSFVLNLNGNAITVSNAIYEEMCESEPDLMARRPLTAEALRMAIIRRKGHDRPPLTFAMVFPFSSHHYELRYWLASAGIHPDRDVRLVVTPPSQMMHQLKSGEIDGYCVGEPWNMAAVEAGIGRTLITSYEIWSNRPEKVLGVSERFAQDRPATHLALTKALIEAARWLDPLDRRVEAAEILSWPEYVDAPAPQVLPSITGTARQTGGNAVVSMPDFNVFHRYAANFPWRSHAAWIATQMIRWGHAAVDVDVKAAAERAYRPDVFRKAADDLGAPCPTLDYRTEGGRPHTWLLEDATKPIACGPTAFFDGGIFDANAVEDYLEGFDIHSMRNRTPPK